MSSYISPQRRPRVYNQLSDNLEINLVQVIAAVELFDKGNTVPFVARYRKEATGCLSDTQLRSLFTELKLSDEVEEKRKEVSTALAAQEALTDSLEMEIDSAHSIGALDEIYLPFKMNIKTKATLARERGLQILTKKILDVEFHQSELRLTEEELEGCRDIITEELSRLPEIKQKALETLTNAGRLLTKKTEFAEQTKSESNGLHAKVAKGLTLSRSANLPATYEHYFNNTFSVCSLRPSQILAINRAEKLGFIQVDYEWNVNPVLNRCRSLLVGDRALTVDSEFQITMAVHQSVDEFIKPAAETSVRELLTRKAMLDAIKTFSTNLWNLLLTPPLVGRTVMGIDPGFRTGCKVCVCCPQGRVLDTKLIHPFIGNCHQARKLLMNLITLHGVEVIALGDGSVSKETESFLCETLKEGELSIGWTLVSEDGASVYSISELASHELPEMDVSLRGAVSIARRLLDPLAELVKIDPAHLGIGLYQHDMDRKLLNESLSGVVEAAVNSVGINLNTASPSLLGYVAGLSYTLAEKIVKHRERFGAFENREELLKVDGINKENFQQCVGFLRIQQGVNPLDNTGVHPESYHFIHELLEYFFPDRMSTETISQFDLDQLRECLTVFEKKEESKGLEQLAERLHIGKPTLQDLVENVMSPGRDIRGQASSTSLKWRIEGSISDLKTGAMHSGIVKNVVEFGAFVDLNIGVTGLVHVSEMKSEAGKRTKWINPHDIVKVGDRVNVQVLDVDIERNRVSLKLIHC